MTTMNASISLIDNSLTEERMAVRIVLAQALLIFLIYAFYNIKNLLPSASIDLNRDEVVKTAPSQPASFQNIVDMIWSCQPSLILTSREYCTNQHTLVHSK